MADYTDQEIIDANQGRISEGEYVVFKGNLVIKWVSKDVNKVNVLYEKKQNNTTQDYLVGQNIDSNQNIINSYTWNVPFSGNPQHEYPVYRIKVVSSITNNVVAYSNPFKVSINMGKGTGK